MDIEQGDICQHCGVVLDESSTCPLCGEFYGKSETGTSPIPTRSQMPTTMITDERSCKVCGHIMDDDSATCPMCNSPILSEVEEEPEFRCPVCENPIEQDASVCPFCEVDLVGKEEKVEMNFRCPACQEIMRIDDHQCGHCGAKIWLDLEEEVRRIEEYRCPMCDVVVQEDSEKCPKCGADIWMRDEDALKEEATSKLEEAVAQIKIEKEETDSDLSKAIKFLIVAREAMEKNDYGRASKCATLSLDLARSAGLQKKLLNDAMQRAERTVTLVNKKGGDVVRAKELEGKLQESAENGHKRKGPCRVHGRSRSGFDDRC
jgi:RNA polymerase subunit RPABC4/transcription elongation factor Spt4